MRGLGGGVGGFTRQRSLWWKTLWDTEVQQVNEDSLWDTRCVTAILHSANYYLDQWSIGLDRGQIINIICMQIHTQIMQRIDNKAAPRLTIATPWRRVASCDALLSLFEVSSLCGDDCPNTVSRPPRKPIDSHPPHQRRGGCTLWSVCSIHTNSSARRDTNVAYRD